MDLSERQVETLKAAANRIIPDDEDCGAWQAGAGLYLARQFAGDLRASLPVYRAGLDALDAEAAARRGAAFSAIDAQDQDDLLRRLEVDDVLAAWPIAPRKFLAMLVDHVAEGFYGDPGNGGNRGACSWSMIGFEPPAERTSP